MSANPEWLEKSVFYQIYPQSYADSNGDGIGDLPGLIQRLDYIQSIGVNAIWINPCFVSPFQDAGYDVADYYHVAPRYGTDTDLARMFREANRRGIRVLLDLVPGHTSIQHPWFQESCRHERNRYSDYYIWTDNAWTWEVPGYRLVSGFCQRDAAYVANFFYSQPALNYGFANPDPHHPWQQPIDAPGPQAVRQEMKNVMRHWLELGASGFRVDMAFSLIKNDPSGTETSFFWQDIRAWLDRDFPQAAIVSEWGRPKVAIPAGFHMDFMLPFGMPGYISLLRKSEGPGPGSDPYGFSFFDLGGRGNIIEFLDNYLEHYTPTQGKGFIAIPTGNHDTGPRLARNRSWDEIEVIYAFLLSMPGTPFMYYGDEIGLRGISGLPSVEGAYKRAEVRTPMQWDHTLNAGFSTTDPGQLYLPIESDPDLPTVAAQDSDPNSLLNRVRHLIAVRKAHPALCASGEFEVVYARAGELPFVYRRRQGNENILIAINPCNRPVEVALPGAAISGQPTAIYGDPNSLTRQGETWSLKLSGISACMFGAHETRRA
jgi:glycosidase